MTASAKNPNGGEQRMRVFASFFKGYMGSAPMIAAALPIPVTAGKIIPTYAEQTGYLSTYTSLFCFLIVALVFYRRHRLGSYLLPETWEKKSRRIGRLIISWLPLLLIIATLASIITYHLSLNCTISEIMASTGHTRSEVLKQASVAGFSYLRQGLLLLSYLGIFLFSTSAFALMAVREYMQNVLKLSEAQMVERTLDPFCHKEGSSARS